MPKKTKEVIQKVRILPIRDGQEITFDQWASRRGILPHQRPGMRAHLQDTEVRRTLEEWDQCFVGY